MKSPIKNMAYWKAKNSPLTRTTAQIPAGTEYFIAGVPCDGVGRPTDGRVVGAGPSGRQIREAEMEAKMSEKEKDKKKGNWFTGKGGLLDAIRGKSGGIND